MNQKNFSRIERLPPYVFSVIGEMKSMARKRGEDIIDMSMGNPDQPTPEHIVRKLNEVATKEHTHGYSASKGILRLRKAVCEWYKKRYSVAICKETEAIVTIGSKEGLAHLMLATLDRGDTILVPNPSYPIHIYGAIIAGADVRSVRMTTGEEFFSELERAIAESIPKPKMIILGFPSNPTGECIDLRFFEKVIGLAKKHDIFVVHDLAYADICFDGYKAPSILQVSGAKDYAVEFFSMSKSYNMAGWRVGFMVGNANLVSALAKIKSYFDYGTFTPIQVAAVVALESEDKYVSSISETYQARRDTLVSGLNAIGWENAIPKATMYLWAKIPEPFMSEGSLGFAKRLLSEAKVAVSPGIGFGQYGEGFIRFALIENHQRIKQAIRGIREMFKKAGIKVNENH